MQSHVTGQPSIEIPDTSLQFVSAIPDTPYSMTEESTQTGIEPMRFQSHYVDYMEMSADTQTVAQYFDAHHLWFTRCAHPMHAEPLGETGYILVIGKFGSFGYEVEPKIGLDLLPQQAGVYRIETIAVPGFTAPGYDVDFRAAMELLDTDVDKSTELSRSPNQESNRLTRVQWQLDLTVTIHFPRFIHALPKTLIQKTGDRLLNQIVRQVSKQLTHKVLEDFHQTHGVPIPKRSKRWLF